MNKHQTQTFANHVRFHPPFHFVLAPLLVFFCLLAGINLYRAPGRLTLSVFVGSVAVFLAGFLTRVYALQVQDRLIRLEEQLRMARILPDDLRKRVSELTIPQIVALRFASDGELASLVGQTLAENLNSRQIKEKIRDWRPDFNRV